MKTAGFGDSLLYQLWVKTPRRTDEIPRNRAFTDTSVMTVVALCLEHINPATDISIPIFSLVLVTLALYVLGITTT